MIGDGFYFGDVIDGNDTYEVKIANADGSFRTETREAKHSPDFGMSILNGIGSAIGNSLFTTRDERAYYKEQRDALALQQTQATANLWSASEAGIGLNAMEFYRNFNLNSLINPEAKTAEETSLDRQEKAMEKHLQLFPDNKRPDFIIDNRTNLNASNGAVSVTDNRVRIEDGKMYVDGQRLTVLETGGEVYTVGDGYNMLHLIQKSKGEKITLRSKDISMRLTDSFTLPDYNRGDWTYENGEWSAYKAPSMESVRRDGDGITIRYSDGTAKYYRDGVSDSKVDGIEASYGNRFNKRLITITDENGRSVTNEIYDHLVKYTDSNGKRVNYIGDSTTIAGSIYGLWASGKNIQETLDSEQIKWGNDYKSDINNQRHRQAAEQLVKISAYVEKTLGFDAFYKYYDISHTERQEKVEEINGVRDVDSVS